MTPDALKQMRDEAEAEVRRLEELERRLRRELAEVAGDLRAVREIVRLCDEPTTEATNGRQRA